MLSHVCAAVGTQPALVDESAGPDGSYQFTKYFISEAALLATAAKIIGVSVSDANCLFVMRKCEECWLADGARVRCLVKPGVPAKMIERFANERELIDAAYAKVPKLKICIQETLGNSNGGNGVRPSATAAQAEVEQHLREQKEICERFNEDLVRMGQASGVTPMYYKDGIPHYGGFNMF